MDFITNLSSSKAFDSIFVKVNQLTKMAHFKPCNKTVRSEETVRLLMDNIYKYHGLPNNIISDRGSQFTSKFWQSLFKINGQTEKVNQVLEQYLHCTITFYQDNWTELLPLVRFVYNNTIQESIQ
jgi:transposase InsO family protein